MSDSNKTGPKDVFGQLLAIIGLYVCVIAFGALVFGLVNLYFPDVLNYDYGQFARGSLRWPLAILVIVFPLFLWWNSYIQKDLEKNPEKKELRSRKWFLHFTLFVAAIVIVGDLVSLIFRFLNGDLTVQFVLKILAVFLIASTVFIYYLWNIRRSVSAMKHPKMKWFVRGVVALAAFFIVFGFFNAGSPFSERMRRFDERRVSDLQMIQSEIVYYWQAKRVLPQNLDQLQDSIRGFIPPRDPETGGAYKYNVKGSFEFELCTVFKTSSEESRHLLNRTIQFSPPKPFPYNESWLHGIGETCFTRTIDPERDSPPKGSFGPRLRAGAISYGVDPDLFPPLEKPSVR